MITLYGISKGLGMCQGGYSSKSTSTNSRNKSLVNTSKKSNRFDRLIDIIAKSLMILISSPYFLFFTIIYLVGRFFVFIGSKGLFIE